ncbi:MAG: excinuclease ABC subunit UvrA [bacterium]|nr:excinuclease ABC subunit A [Deltaproteobacteria bacterium]MCP4903533.1 excinuclease ABC subunit UvrA [bacterium]
MPTPKKRSARPRPARRKRDKPQELDHIEIRGAREHNLRSIDVDLPKKKLVVMTGVSGSGKSSLAFDTLYAEGQRRYVESLSAYARQFLGQMEKPRYDTIRGLSPTISIEQKTTGNNPRSTVGTITEISDYLRVLWARTGLQHCHICGDRVESQTAEQIAKTLGTLAKGAKLVLLSPLLVNRKGEHRELLEEARRAGWLRLRVDGEIVETEGLDALDKRKKHDVEAVIDRLVVKPGIKSRLTESVETALRIGDGQLIASTMAGGTDSDQTFSEHAACAKCQISFPELTPQAFSFNSPQGMCSDCNGLGNRFEIDPDLVVPDDSLSIDGGAIRPWGEKVSEKEGWGSGFHKQILAHLKISTTKSWRRLTEKQHREILHGTGERRYRVTWSGKNGGGGQFDTTWEGLIPRLMRRFRDTKSEGMKRWYGKFMADTACTTCEGARLRIESAAVRVANRTLVEISSLTVDEARVFFDEIRLTGAALKIATEVLKEIRSRLDFLAAVGLGYLSLDRAGPSLSGGESQRIRLASQVGSDLTGVIYILDEPSIGLHPRDNRRLLETLERMRDIGNTVVVVEHDEETIRAADYVVDFGPGAGVAGGELVHAGTPKTLERDRGSVTGDYLSGRREITIPTRRRVARGSLKIQGAQENNLLDIDVEVPLGILTAVTGVSGAGKSTLVNDILYPAAARELVGSSVRIGRHRRLSGLGQLDKVIDIDQRPIGRTPRSNPATYIKVFDEIRRFFSDLPESKIHGYKPGRFSFNVKGGRCEACEGDGVRKIEMHFLADVFVRCEQCRGKRFNEATLRVEYRGHSIADVLDLTVAEAIEVFSAHRKVAGPLKLLQRVGLDYLHLGQPSPTLSGGEAQRIKLARELSKRATGRTLYILDEPTTGLHFEDVRKLLIVLNELVEAGNSVVVIEHNLDVIKTADWIIDLGPEGGPEGGEVVAVGTPEDLAQVKQSHTGKSLGPVLKTRRPKRKTGAKKR